MTLGRFSLYIAIASIILLAIGISLQLPQNGLARFFITAIKLICLLIGILLFIIVVYVFLKGYMF